MASSSKAILGMTSKGNGEPATADETRLLIDDVDDENGNEDLQSNEPYIEQPRVTTASSTHSNSTQPQTKSPARTRSRSGSSASNSRFIYVKIAARIAAQVIRKFWAFSSAALLALILFYWLCGGFFAFLLVVFGATGILYHAGDRLLYHPEQPATSRVYVPSPSIVGLTFDSVFIKAKDSTRIHLFLIKQVGERLAEAPTLLFLHGNAGNIGN